MTPRIGRYTCTFPTDGRMGPLPARDVIADEAVADALGVFETPLVVPVLRAGDEVILVDAGLGHSDTAGLLPAILRDEGIEPDAVGHVVVTHMHGDHVGGLFRDGALTFPRARVHVSKADVAWVRETGRDTTLLEALEEAGLLAELDDLPDGIEAIDTPGHTPGHAVFRVAGRDAALIAGGDTVLIAEQLADPSIRLHFDADHDAAAASRRLTLELAMATDTMVSWTHLDPPVGRIERSADGWRWQA